MPNRTYLAIDLKSFYASVECIERGLDPLTTHLVVADESRTEKTICLAVSPALKAYGIPSRARLFEVVQQVRRVNAARCRRAPGRRLAGQSCDAAALSTNPALALSYITAVPRMAHYIEYSTRIYEIYLQYVAPEDIHVYSIDEVFVDVTPYLATYGLSARALAQRIVQDVLRATGITATAGIGSNLYLCKVAMDIVAKHVQPDRSGVRIATLSEQTYRRLLWAHQPLTDFWRVGRGYAQKLAAHGLLTMGDIARCSLGGPGDYHNQNLLYRLFGVNAELLIDHAWGWEPCTMADIKAYRPAARSLGAGQVLHAPYPFDRARLVLREMAVQLALDLLAKHLAADRVTLTVGYDITNLTDPVRRAQYTGPVTTDFYGRQAPQHAHGTASLGRPTASAQQITDALLDLFDHLADPRLLVRRLTIAAGHVVDERTAAAAEQYEQLDLFTDYAARQREQAARLRERHMQQAMLSIRHKYGKNALFCGMDLLEGATALSRNAQIGGHRA